MRLIDIKKINIPSRSEIEGVTKNGMRYTSKWEKIGVGRPFKLLAKPNFIR